MAADDQFIRGAGMLAVLKVLEDGELYGYAIVEALGRTKGEALHLGQSTVYPMLYNLEAKGLVKSRWDESGARPRKYYSLTKAGKSRLAEDTDQWREITKAMASLGLARVFSILACVTLAVAQPASAQLPQASNAQQSDASEDTQAVVARLYERAQSFEALAGTESRERFIQTGIADEAMTRWLEAARSLGPDFVAGMQRSRARPLDLAQGYDLLLPHLAPQRALVQVMRLLAHDAVARGDTTLATKIIGAQVASVRGIGDDHVLVSSLVSIATLRTSLATVTDLLDGGSLDAAGAASIAVAREGLGALMQQQLREALRTESEFPSQELERMSALDDAGWKARLGQFGLTDAESASLDRSNLETMQADAARFRDAMSTALESTTLESTTYESSDPASLRNALQSLESRLGAGEFGAMLKALGPASLWMSLDRLETVLAQLDEQDVFLKAIASGAKQPDQLANAARHYLAASHAVVALDAETQRIIDALRIAPESLDEADRRAARRAMEALRSGVIDRVLRATSLSRCVFDDSSQPEPDLVPEGCEGALGALRLMLFDPLVPGERPPHAPTSVDACVAALVAVRHFAEGGGIGRALIAQQLLRDLTWVLAQPEVARHLNAEVRTRFETELARFKPSDPLGFQRAVEYERGRIAAFGSTPTRERTAGTPFGRERLARLSPDSIVFLVATLTTSRPALEDARCACSFDGPLLDVRGLFDLTALVAAQRQSEMLRARLEAIVFEGVDDDAPAIRSLSVTQPLQLAARQSDALAAMEHVRTMIMPSTTKNVGN